MKPTQPSELRVFDFAEVGGQLKRAGGNIGRFATVIHNNYLGALSSNLLYRVTVEAGDGAFLCVDAHTLAFDWFGVRAMLHIGRDSALCAAWMFSDARRSRLDAGEPTLCIRCLKDCADGACPQLDTDITEIPLSKLRAMVVAWVRSELPAGAFRNRTPA